MITPFDSPAILFVDDDLRRRHFAVNWMPRAFLAHDVDGAIKILRQLEFGRHPQDLVMLDFDLAPGLTTEPIAHHLAGSRFAGHVIVHSENPFAWQLLSRILPSAVIKPFPVLRSEIEHS